MCKEYQKKYYLEHKNAITKSKIDRSHRYGKALRAISLLTGQAGDIAREALGIAEKNCEYCGKILNVGIAGGYRSNAKVCSASCATMKYRKAKKERMSLAKI